MARAISTDFFYSNKFRVTVIGGSGGGRPNREFGTAEGGFSTCTTPNITIEQAQYKSGLDTYPKKFPGNPSVSDITLTRGQVRRGSSLFKWILAAIQGLEYRVDILIERYHPDEVSQALATSPSTIADPGSTAGGAASKGVSYKLYNAFAYDVKIGSDFDANSSEISLEEVQVCFESFDIINESTTVGV